MSEVKVNKISPRSGTDVTLGDSGDTITVPTGVTLDTSNSTVTLPDGSVTSAKLNNDIISGATELATEPADTDEFLVSDAGTLKRIDYSLIKGGGITGADQWRITADHTGVADVTTNWERADTAGFNYIGTGMTESSGIFTFPETGIWSIQFITMPYVTGADTAFLLSRIETTVDNSNYTAASDSYVSIYEASAYGNGNCYFIFDVTNTTTHKCKFKLAQTQAGTGVFQGNTNNNSTFATFIRLGDT